VITEPRGFRAGGGAGKGEGEGGFGRVTRRSTRVAGRGLLSSTFRLNVSAFSGTGSVEGMFMSRMEGACRRLGMFDVRERLRLS